MNDEKDIKDDIKNLLDYIRKYGISLSKKGKERPIKTFPSLNDEIMGLPEDQDPASENRKTEKD